SGDLASDHARVIESTVGPVTAGRWTFAGATLTDVVLHDVSAAALTATEARWRQVEWTGGRVAALDAVRAEWDGVHVRGVRFDYVNLASAKLTDVLFTDCVFATVDLPEAELSRVAFAGCRADEVDTRGLRASHLDLRGLDVAGFTDVAGLRGATLSEEQAAFHGRALARALGIVVR
ncbi:MAG: hypothetical protein EOO67_05355, partial [Microbacterium sp.]